MSDVPPLVIGSKPIDAGNYIFTADERREFLKREPSAAAFMRPFVGSEEYINGGERWILVLDTVSPSELRSMPAVMERIAAVRKNRLESSSLATRQLADTPTRFHVTVIPDRPFLCIPETSSERREYVPIGWLEPPTVPSNLVRVLLQADLWHFAVLTSRMHMAWLRHIGGRLKSDPRYSIGIVYNAFPWPEATEVQREGMRKLAQTVLDARAQFPTATLADLYEHDVMPSEIRTAHHSLDSAVEKLYRTSSFNSDQERVEHLFGLYEKMMSPLMASADKKSRRKRTKLSAPPASSI